MPRLWRAVGVARLNPLDAGLSRGSLLVAVATTETGPDRDQTGDLFVANEALYQLSYWPVERKSFVD